MGLSFSFAQWTFVAILVPSFFEWSALAQTPTSVTVNLGERGTQIPSDFVGLSMEVNLVRPMFLGTPERPNEVFFQLLRNLGGPGTFRFGGLSQDRYCWDEAGAPDPAGCSGSLAAADLQSFFYASSRTGWPVLVGLNLAQNSGAWAAQEVKEGILPNSTPEQRLGVEIGNEPDGYYEDKFANGSSVRPSTYESPDYIRDFQGYVSALSTGASTSIPMAGPAFNGRWHQPQLDQFLGAIGNDLSIATMHWYPTVLCRGPVSIADLLDPAILAQYRQVVGGWRQTAENHGLGLQLTETNSTACSGMPGVSDAFASAIWGIDWMLYSAELNLRRINFHSGEINGQNSYYNPIASTAGSNGLFDTEARPLYYAMHLFEAAAPGNALYPVAVQSAANITAYATSRCEACPVHMFVINKDLSASADVSVDFGRGMGSAFALALSAPALDSTTDASYGGRQFDGATGLLDGIPDTNPVPADGGGIYHLRLDNSSAVLLTVLRQGAGLPALPSLGIVSAAGSGQTLSPGGLASAFGVNLTGTTESSPAGVLPTRLGGVQLIVGGVPAPEIYASPGQINFQIPFEVAPGPATLVYTNGAIVSDPIPVTIAQFAPAIFLVPQVSGTQGAILINGSPSLAAPDSSVPGAHPAERGGFISIFCTGLGAVNPSPPSGVPAASIQLSTTLRNPSVTIGGAAAPVQFSGLAPDYSGLYQVNVQVPAGVAPGDSVPVVLFIGGVVSNTATIAVR